MSFNVLAVFWLVSFLLVLVPGADWACVIAVGLRDRSIVPAVGGVLAGYVTLTAVAAAGVATLVARSSAVLGGVHTVNCAVVYLSVGLAARTVLRTRPSIAKAVTRCSGIAMIAIAVVLLAERALGH